MPIRFVSPIADGASKALLDVLRNDLDMPVVAYGAAAISLQYSDVPSPHAVSLDANVADGRVVLEFYGGSRADAIATRDRLVARASARGITLSFLEA